MATDKIQTGLRLDALTLAKITLIAKEQNRSLNAQIEFAVKNCIKSYEKEFGEIIVNEEDYPV